MSSIAEQAVRFGAWDYTVFGVMLSVSTAIGVYFGFFAHTANTTDEYLMGGKKMKTIPIAISLMASQISGLSIMSVPSELYAFGINYAFFCGAAIFVIPILNYLVIPVFYQNNVSNCYEYLEQRFDAKIRKLVTIVFLIKVFLIMPLYIFIPALAFSQVTDINIHIVNTVVCSICIFYTMIGGIKTVVWTDVVQGMVMLASVAVVAFIGVHTAGGFGEVVAKGISGGRLNLNTNFDLTSRSTIWNNVIGGVLLWTSHVGFTQSCVQRIVALPTVKHAQAAMIYFTIGLVLILGFCNFTGLVMFAMYSDCDPVKAGVVAKADKMVPYFVQHLIGHLKGMPGFFISCVFSAALSTMSASLNSLSGIVYFDYIRPWIRHTEERANFIMKLLVCGVGIYCILAGFVVEQVKSLLQIVMSVSGVGFGCLFGVFMLGLLVPRAHSKPTLIAIVVALILSIGVVLIGKIQMAKEEFTYEQLPSSTDGCSSMNITVQANVWKKLPSATPDVRPFDIFKLSFQWYAVVGSLLVWIVGVPLSYLMKPKPEEALNPKLIAPILRRFLPKERIYSEVPLEEKKIDVVSHR